MPPSGADHRLPARILRVDARSAAPGRAALLVLFAAAWLAACQPPVEELRRRADKALAAGDPATAIVELKNLLQRQPRDPVARADLGEAYLASGDAAAAESELRRAIELGAPREALVLPLCQALLAQGRNEAVLVEVGRADETVRRTAPLLLVTGRAHEAAGHLPEAEQQYRAAIAAAPTDPSGFIATAALLLNQGRGGDADVLIAQALVRDPGNATALVLQGRRRMETDGPEVAEALFREAAQVARDPRLRGLALMHLVEALLVQGRLDEAGTVLDDVERTTPPALLSHFLRARWLAQTGAYADAIRRLQEIVRDYPDYEPGLRLLGTVHYLNGNLEQATMYLSRVVPPEGGDSFVRQLLAQLRLEQDRPEQALQTLLPAMRQGPATVFDQGLLVLAGQASLRLGDNRSALDYFRRGAAAYPGDVRFALGEVSARLASGDVAMARQLLERIRATSTNDRAVAYLAVLTDLLERRLGPAREGAQRLVAENAGAPWAHLLLAAVAAAAGDLGTARTQFAEVVRIDPTNREASLALARIELQQGDGAAAEARLRRLVEVDGSDYRPQVMLAESQLSAGRVADALETARGAVRAAPDLPSALNVLGRTAAAAGRWDEATQAFERITAVDARNSRAWLNLARAAAAAGRPTGVSQALQRAADLAPGDPLVLVTAGDLLMSAHDPRGAADKYAAAWRLEQGGPAAMRECQARLALAPGDPCATLGQWLRGHPDDPDALAFLGSLQAQRGERAAAVASYEHAARLRPDDAMVLNNLAALYFEADDRRAREFADRALAREPGSAAIQDTAGWIRLKTGDVDGGRRLIESAAQGLPNNREIQQHLAAARAAPGGRNR